MIGSTSDGAARPCLGFRLGRFALGQTAVRVIEM